MKYLVVAIALALAPTISGQKLTKEEKQKARQEEEAESTRPRSVTIHATPEAIKAELIRVHLADGFKLCKETPSQLVFCKYLTDKQQAAYGALYHLTVHWERSFVLVPTENAINVLASSEAVETNRLGGENRLREMDKKTRDELQAVLDKLKQTTEPSTLQRPA